MAKIDSTKRRFTRITCAPHVTPFLRREVEETLGFEIQEEDHVAMHIGATLIESLTLCLKLRTAHHVMWLLNRFRCPSPQALYTHVSSFPWETFIATGEYLTVTSNVENPKITNSMYPNLVVKDAIVDRINKHAGARPDSGPDRTGVVIHLDWKSDRAWVYLNVNGQRLADRGYRRIPHTAPMQETLAAAVLMAAGYDGTQPLLNPMCGSGTIAIEAALLATGRAPGLLRANFSALHTMLDVREAWDSVRRDAKKASIKSAPLIVASDIDPRAIQAAKKNAQTAGVDLLIQFETCDFSETTVPVDDESQSGHVILNPEYGERLGGEDMRKLEETYSRIGDFLKQRCPGWIGHVFTGNAALAKHIGLRTSRRQPFMNARIDCRLLSYALYVGSREKGVQAD